MAGKSHEPFQLTGRYADRHRWEVLGGAGDGRPTGEEVVKDEGLVGALPDKVFLVTGVSSGMGPATVRALALTGATVFATARNLPKAEAALGGAEGGLLAPAGRVHLLHVDQADLASVRACAAELRARTPGGLHVMVNNAAVMKTPEGGRSKDGLEIQLATNHLSHFLLFYLLRDLLIASATPEFPSRVVNVTSLGHRYGSIHFDNLSLEGEYGDGWPACESTPPVQYPLSPIYTFAALSPHNTE